MGRALETPCKPVYMEVNRRFTSYSVPYIMGKINMEENCI
jgi:hypothetical protein